MREYGQIQCSFWQHGGENQWGSDEMLLGAYLLSGPHSNGIGAYRLPYGYIADDLHWQNKRIDAAFAKLSSDDFCRRFGDVVVIPKFLKWNPIANGKVAKARQKEFESIPNRDAKTYAAGYLLEFGNHFDPGFLTRLETVSDRDLNQDPTQPNPTQPNPTQPNPKGASAPRSTGVDRFDEFWAEYPRKVKKQDALKKWKSKKLDAKADELIADVKNRKQNDRRWLEGYAPDPTTYINGERWNDEIEPLQPGRTDGRAWEEVVKFSGRSSSDRADFIESHPEYRDAINAVGGINQIGLMNEWQQKEARTKFLETLEATA